MKLFFNSLILWLSIVKLNAQNIANQANWQQNVDYVIQAELHPNDKIIDGKIQLTYHNNSPSQLDFIYIHLWPNAYSNTETPFAKQLLLNGKTNFHFSDDSYKGYIKDLNFKIGDLSLRFENYNQQVDIVKVFLNSPLKSGDSVCIETVFKEKLPYLFSRSGYEKKSFFSVTQWYPKPAVFDVNGWHPMSYLDQGEFYSEFGTFDVTIIVPDSITVAATGNLIGYDSINGKKKYRFEEKNVHDFAWFASPYFKSLSRRIIINTIDTIDISLYDADKEPNNGSLLNLEYALRQYSKLVGRYPYKTCKVVIGGIKAGQGMEYPTITICDLEMPEVIIHEVGHNWFYGILASNERQYPWMDESINSYFEKRIMLGRSTFPSEIQPDSNFYKTLKQSDWIGQHSSLLSAKMSQNMGLRQSIDLNSEAYTSYNYAVSIYGVGPLAFTYLNTFLGDSLYLLCFKNYYNEWQFKHPLPGDMQKSFEQTTSLDLSWFFKDVLSDDGSIDVRHNKHGFYIKGSNRLDSAIDRKKHPNAYGLLIEKSFYNNHQKRSFIRLRIPFGLPTYNKLIDVNLTPYVAYNLYDGVYASIAFNNAILNQRKFSYIFAPAYSLKEKSIIGYGKISYSTNFKSKIQRLSLGIQSQMYGINTLSNYNRYYRVHPFVKIHFGEKLPSSKIQFIELSAFHTGLMKSSYIMSIDTLGNSGEFYYPNKYFFNYLRASYSFDNGDVINRLAIKLNAEYGTNNKHNVAANSYLKTFANAIFKHQYKKKKFIRSEAFIGAFIFSKGDIDNQKFFVSANSGNRDYLYSEVLIGRNENRYSNMFIGRQIINQGGIRNLTDLEPSDRYMFTLANDFDFPGIIPAALYFDCGYYNFMHRVNNANVGLKSDLVFTGGVSIKLLKRQLEIFIPIVVSSQFKAFNQINNSFLNSIGFKLHLNQLDPVRAINNGITTLKTDIGNMP